MLAIDTSTTLHKLTNVESYGAAGIVTPAAAGVQSLPLA
jgi:hypothetical protein